MAQSLGNLGQSQQQTADGQSKIPAQGKVSGSTSVAEFIWQDREIRFDITI
jgi:hypothetical protein